jgi:hypothetical protein
MQCHAAFSYLRPDVSQTKNIFPVSRVSIQKLNAPSHDYTPALVYNHNYTPALVHNHNYTPALVYNHNYTPALVCNHDYTPVLVYNQVLKTTKNHFNIRNITCPILRGEWLKNDLVSRLSNRP